MQGEVTESVVYIELGNSRLDLVLIMKEKRTTSSNSMGFIHRGLLHRTKPSL